VLNTNLFQEYELFTTYIPGTIKRWRAELS
jgi:hypothetical protein